MNLLDEINKITSNVTSQITDSAKNSAIQTLNDPEFREAINGFVRNWYEENKFLVLGLMGSFLLLTMMAITNVITDFTKR